MLLVVAGVLIATMGGDKIVAFGGSFVVDRFAKFLKLLVLVGSIGAILLSGRVPVAISTDASSSTRSSSCSRPPACCC